MGQNRKMLSLLSGPLWAQRRSRPIGEHEFRWRSANNERYWTVVPSPGSRPRAPHARPPRGAVPGHAVPLVLAVRRTPVDERPTRLHTRACRGGLKYREIIHATSPIRCVTAHGPSWRPWAAAMAVFLGIAAALLAGGAHGPLASARRAATRRPARTAWRCSRSPCSAARTCPRRDRGRSLRRARAPDRRAGADRAGARPGPEPGRGAPGGRLARRRGSPRRAAERATGRGPGPRTGRAGRSIPATRRRAADASGAPIERPVAEPEPPMESPAPAEPPAGDDASRPPPIDPDNAAGGPPHSGHGDPGQPVEPPASSPRHRRATRGRARRRRRRSTSAVAQRDEAALQRTVRFARAHRLPATGGGGRRGRRRDGAEPAPAGRLRRLPARGSERERRRRRRAGPAPAATTAAVRSSGRSATSSRWCPTR